MESKDKMTDPVTFTGHITFEDAQRIEKLLSPRKWSALGISTIVILAVFGLSSMSMQTSVIFKLSFFACVGAFIGGCIWLGIWTGIGARRRAYESGRTEREVTIRPDKLIVTTPVSSTDLEWRAFKKVLFLQDLVVATDGREFLAWAPYNFETNEDWERAVTLSNEKQEELQQQNPELSPAAVAPDEA